MAKKSIRKKWWFWVIVAVLGIGIAGTATADPIVTEERSEFAEIPCEKKQQDDPELAKGETKVLQECVDGEKETVFEVRTQGDREISRKQVSERVKKEAVAEIMLVGTKEEVPEPVYVPPANTNNNSASSSSSSSNSNTTPGQPVENPNLPLKAICNDGTISYQDTPSHPNYQGMCSGHGGIRTKLGRVP